MDKLKYEKPVARNLDAIQPVQGSCLSGVIEYIGGSCESGATATPNCTTGSTVIPFVPCSVGSSAGQSCFMGEVAA